MSVVITIHLVADDLPSAVSILDQVHAFGVQFAFPSGFDLAADSGYVPCLLNGIQCGFEYSIRDGDAIDRSTREFCFETRSSHVDYAASSLVSGAVALLGRGSLSVEDEEPLAWDKVSRWLQRVEVPKAEPDAEILQIPVTVVGSRGNGLLELKLGKIKAGAHVMRKLINTIPIDQVPNSLRLPNSQFLILVRDAHEIVGIKTL